MKQIIIFLLIIILAIVGFSKYNQYKRYNSPEVDYKTDKKIDVNYHDKDILFNYYTAIEDLNSYVMLQWTANDIDVRTPEDDDNETKNAVNVYNKKLAKVKFYEDKLHQSLNLKEKGLSNDEIIFIENEGLELKDYQQQQAFATIKKLYNPDANLYNGERNAIVYEVQKRLTALGDSIQIDGVYRIETLNAIKKFEENNHLLADGYLDILTIEKMFE